jgi:putative oxidoreductase
MTATTTTETAPRPARGSIITSGIASTIAKLVALCAIIPYALVALGLRFVIARVFFLFGQPMIDGPTIPFSWLDRGLTFTVILPAEIKEATFRMFQTQYAALPMPPTVAAYVFAYALFVLPICVLFGFATRIAALGLLVLTVLLSVYVTPEALWGTHVYWGAILLVLMTVGPGAISIDSVIRYVYEK